MDRLEGFQRSDKPKEVDLAPDVDREFRRVALKFLAGQEIPDVHPLEEPREMLDFREQGLIDNPLMRIPAHEEALQVSGESRAGAMHREERGRALESMVSLLPALEAAVLRLHEGVLGDVPMKAGDIASIFKHNSYKQKRIFVLENEQSVSALPGDDFDSAMLFLLGRLPKQNRTYTFEEMGEIFDWNRESARKTAIKALGRLQEAAAAYREEPEI